MSWVEEFRDQGFGVFPLRQDDRIPAVKGWKKYAGVIADESRIGIALRSHCVVIDIDPRNFATEDAWSNFKEEYGFSVPADTFVVSTPRGGYHIYLTKPSNVDIRAAIPVKIKDASGRSVPKYPGIEFKTKGSYVVGPDVETPNGKYTVVQGSIDHLAPMPQNILDAITKQKMDVKDVVLDVMDSKLDVARYSQYLNDHPGAVEGMGGDRVTFAVAAEGRDYGLSEETTYSLMLEIWNEKCDPEWSEEELRTKVTNAYSYSEGKQGAKSLAAIMPQIADQPGVSRIPLASRIEVRERADGTIAPAPTLKNLYSFLELETVRRAGEPAEIPNPLHKLFKYNAFSGKIEIAKKDLWPRASDTSEVQEFDGAGLRIYLARHHNVEFSTEKIREAMELVARKYQYHPIRDYLESLEWDGVERCHKLFTYYLGADQNAYTHTVGRCFLISLVARMYSPGCKVDTMPILEGPQGLRKSEFGKILAGMKYYADITMAGQHKDLVDLFQGKWILEFAELGGMDKVDINYLKAMMTRQVDRVRPAYARLTVDLPRQCVFVSTVNPEDDGGYLVDPTGNRRFWPVECLYVLEPELRRDRDQLYAEAVHRYKAGEPWHITDPLIEQLAQEEQIKRTSIDVWEHRVVAWLEEHPEIVETSAATLVMECLGIPLKDIKPLQTRRIGNILLSNGWKKARVWRNERQIRVFQRLGRQA